MINTKIRLNATRVQAYEGKKKDYPDQMRTAAIRKRATIQMPLKLGNSFNIKQIGDKVYSKEDYFFYKD